MAPLPVLDFSIASETLSWLNRWLFEVLVKGSRVAGNVRLFINRTFNNRQFNSRPFNHGPVACLDG